MHFQILLLPLLASLGYAIPTEVRRELAPRAQCNDAAITKPPAAPTPLPAPPAGTHNVLVAIGKGTQNYTCGNGNAAPTPIGALATLYDASCLALHNPNGLVELTHSTKGKDGPPGGLPVIGRHYFADTTTPVFAIYELGTTYMKKNASSNAPPNDGGDVPWLYLTSEPGSATSRIRAVYRENTAGGSAPPSCAGRKPGVFTVQYAADYYFYSI